ncbi:hypothetical protein Naga_100299g5 [Nannochloropsis gaditana]|uniref:Uncharacterized protein n=1 Tax=Nannochloropsis gaditana TaxID=72520 RepID=W7U1K0_9STRA|nr:hypothetical protein Naga_100299g5 [Nannochloropsis gaditana]
MARHDDFCRRGAEASGSTRMCGLGRNINYFRGKRAEQALPKLRLPTALLINAADAANTFCGGRTACNKKAGVQHLFPILSILLCTLPHATALLT